MSLITEIGNAIETKLEKGYKKFIIFPFGEVGIKVKQLLNYAYGIHEEYILDNYLCKYNNSIKPLAYMNHIECKYFAVLLSSSRPDIYNELKSNLLIYFTPEQIAELPSLNPYNDPIKPHTEIGRYSYGPICHDHIMIKSIGSFCSFAKGVTATMNHEMNFITTHPIIYMGQSFEGKEIDFSEYKGAPYYFEGIKPHKNVKKLKRSTIGNDVWLGHNVIITNGADIGNGVIAGAGAVITKDVPDYAVIAGVPAKIIKYRYSPKQIEQLNKIGWWNWSDEEIKDRFDDFYLPVNKFIEKYL